MILKLLTITLLAYILIKLIINNTQKELDIDLSNFILIGDKNSNIEAGINAKIGKNYLINTGYAINKNKFNVVILDNLKYLLNKDRCS